MTPRIRTLNFLPDIFKTPTNAQFLSATLDQVVQQPRNQRIEGYIGSKFGYGINAKDKYVTEPTKTRTDYQLDPGVVFLKTDTETAKDFISYPGIIDALKLENGITGDNSRLFESEFYSWDSFTDLDKIINFHQYYWVPNGPEAVVVSTDTIFNNVNYIVTYTPNGYVISVEGDVGSSINPNITLLRGGTYTFTVDQTSSFWIQGVPGLTGIDPTQSNIQTRDVIGVSNNGASTGIVTFNVPQPNSLEAFQIDGSNFVDVVTTLAFSAIDGQTLSSLANGIDGITALNGLTLMFYQNGTIGQQQYFYTISFSGSSSDPTLNLTPSTLIPSTEKITVRYGTEWISRSFYRNIAGYITLIPYNSTILDELYYQDSTSTNSVGKIKLVENNATNRVDVLADIIGKTQYTSPNGVVFTNGLKVIFEGNIYPASYENNEYYVQGVGTAIELIAVTSLIAPEPFTSADYIPYDTTPYDIENYDSNLYIPLVPDYITIARNSISRNPWSRSNRWFHIEVLQATASYNNNPDLLTAYTNKDYKAKRPIIEFYPNLKLFNTGIVGKQPIDFFDTRSTDAFNEVEGELVYYPDVEVYTGYDATVASITGPIIQTATQTMVSPNNSILCSSTAGFNVNDIVVFSGTVFGGLEVDTNYYITEVVNSITFKVSDTLGGTPVALTSASGTMTATITPLSVSITVNTTDVSGTFAVGQFIADSDNLLPSTARITSVETVSGVITLIASWTAFQLISGTTNVSIVASSVSNDNYQLYDGARIVFSNDTNDQVRNKIYTARFTTVTPSTPMVITLSVAEDGDVLDGEQVVTFRGYNYQGQSFYYTNGVWSEAQQKTRVNQPPLFDIFDANGISFGNPDYYEGTSFTGNKLFAYGLGIGTDDPILGFPIRYSAVQNVGDISFDVSLNSDSFRYVDSITRSPVTELVNTGYVYNYSSVNTFIREIGWQTAIGPSVQYQIFEFDYYVSSETLIFTCDVSKLTTSEWPTIQVFINNRLVEPTEYTVTVLTNSTVITFTSIPSLVDTVIQVAILSDQVSSTAYYSIPINLNNNPLNADITTVNIGDIRGQYQSIFYNAPDTVGPAFGSNNFRDLGNLVPYGNKIIQNSASLVLPGTFLRQQNHSLFNALMFNSKEYINFKTLLVSTVNNTDYVRYNTASYMLDDALEQITANRTDADSFFWSDMLPSKSAYITNTYNFANSADVTIYPLSRIYNFETANYYSVLVYLTRSNVVTQLIRGIDYTVSTDSPSLIITLDLLPNDQITIKEYNQTYGSYVPNTPTKLGLYPATIPAVILDSDYSQPTYFIVGHDGSYNKLYGSYNSTTGQLTDFRDQVLLEFEKRIYNNLKLSNEIPISEFDVIPGFFRATDYSYDEILEIYSVNFLNWIGQNRIDYKTQFYNANNQYTYNYNRSGNKINKAVIPQGYWRGVYQYFYDTSNPDTKPWEMLGFTLKPSWWQDRYGPAPYTSDNLILWNDLAQGINWNNGDPVVLTQFVRPELLQVIPVDSAGELVSPFNAIVGNYSNQSFRRDWRVGDVGPAELSYRRSSSWPFDLMKILALTKPAQFFNLGVDVDNYKYSSEFNQYLVNNRSHLVISNIEIYGSGIAKTSYINWIVDFEKQVGIDATTNITTLLDNLDVRLVYRVAGFSDKDLLKFYVEKGTPNSTNASLLIPDESYAVLLYDNQPFDRIIYSSVIIQQTTDGYFKVFGNSQTYAYFKLLKAKINGNYENITVGNLTVQTPRDFQNKIEILPYGNELYSVQEVANFLVGYGKYLTQQGVIFGKIESGLEVNWNQMVVEFLYWAQSGWEPGSIINLNPSAKLILIDKESSVVQPLTLHQQNFILNQNLYPIQSVDLAIIRESTAFSAQPLNEGDTVAYGQFNLFNFEHGVVFDNITLFDDVIYNLITGLRQNRIYVRGNKTAEWDGTVDAQGFILNQDNIIEWNKNIKYTKGEIVKYKNKYWTALKIIQPKLYFEELEWKETDYNEIQKGLLPNSSTRSYESTLYYDSNKANLERDADLLSFSLIGYRPRDYLALADLTDITQINVYKNLIKNKGTRNATEAFKGVNLPQGGIEYDIYENWAIKSGEFGGVLNNNFIELRLSQPDLTGNPSIVGLTNGVWVDGVQQQVPLYSLFNYGRPITDANVLPTKSSSSPSVLLPDAGYVNFNDVKAYSYFYSGMANSVTPLNEIYVGDYIWIANLQGKWNIQSPVSQGQLILASNAIANVLTLTFKEPHELSKYQPFAIVNFDSRIDGYYTVNTVIDPYNIQITTTDNTLAQLTVTGSGTVFTFQSHRCTTVSDIINLPLLQNEFYKNKAWVDVGTSGGWEVYRKSINYQFLNPITRTGSSTFGSSVAYTPELGYLISDAGLGFLYRYVFNPLANDYVLFATKSEETSYGSSIAYSGDVVVVSQPTGATASDRKVYVYILDTSLTVNDLVELQQIQAPDNLITSWGSSVAISGDKNWIYVSDTANNRVYVYNKSPVTDLYEFATYITSASSAAGDLFGYSISTNYYGDKVVIGAPNHDYSITVDNWGAAYVFDRFSQTFIAQYNSTPFILTTFLLVNSPPVTSATVTATSSIDNSLTITDTSILEVDIPVAFPGALLSSGAISTFSVYYVKNIINGTKFTISSTRGGPVIPVVTSSGSMPMSVQTKFPYVTQNNNLLQDSEYYVANNTLYILSTILVGDLIEISIPNFAEAQQLTSTQTTRSGSKFGFSVDSTAYTTEILVGSPFEVVDYDNEGVVYRFTNSGSKYGYVTGTTNTNLTTSTTLLINGYAVPLVAGNASSVATQINSANVLNVTASALDGKLTISLLNTAAAAINNKLDIVALSSDIWDELGITPYTKTQTINCPHTDGTTQFGYAIKFNEYGSFVVSAPAGNRFIATTFDQTDDENFDNDTIFDNNTTQWIDESLNAGAVYMFDYLSNYNETLANSGKFIYAQSVNDTVTDYGYQPYYGQALDFNKWKVIVGTPQFDVGSTHGRVVIYENTVEEQDWIVYRSSAPVVDVNKIQNIQLFSALTNETLENLDYIDPLQGKILGVARENIDVISNIDPASYNSPDSTTKGSTVWGYEQLGQIWFNTSNVRFVNYHQDDVVYNSQYWGTVFPGSDVAVYSWIASDVTPIEYTGPGTAFDIDNYVIQYTQDARGNLVPVYYFWVRNANVVFTKRGKTLSDTILESYIENPKASGVSYFASLLPSVFGLYNCVEYINNSDTVLHVGFSTGTSDDVSHSVYTLIRTNYADDFLPGLPNTNPDNVPISLYDRMLDSMSGVDETGAIVPNPYLPKAVQTGIYARPRQSFFLNRFAALKNYLTYANEILSQYPITETRNPNFLNAKNPIIIETIVAGNCQANTIYTIVTIGAPGLWASIGGPLNPIVGDTFTATGPATGADRDTGTASFVAFTEGANYNTPNYWSYVNWWATGYDNNTKSAIQVPIYADLSALVVPIGTIVSVAQNSAGKAETYVLGSDYIWNRIGLEDGTIEFSLSLWDYAYAKFGFGDNFFDTTPYDEYPSEETRNIIRALTEQIYIDELLIHRNKSLILLFEYAQTETIESQNFLPWLNKTSLIDVSHTIRELLPIEVYQSDNEVFLESYLNEAKPYHVLIKEFVFKYTGIETYEGDITDFDLPAQYDFNINQFMTPMLVNTNPGYGNEFLPTDPIWQTTPYNQWFQNKGLTLVGTDNYPITIVAVYVQRNSNSIYVENIYGFPVAGTIKIDEEIIVYSSIDRVENRIYNLTRGYNGTTISTHLPGQQIFIDLPPATLLDSGRGYINPPKITAYIDTSVYSAPARKAVFEAVMNLDKILYINTIDSGDGYEVLPEIVIEPSMSITFASTDVSPATNSIRLSSPVLVTGDLVKYVVGENTTKIGGLYPDQYYYVRVLDVAPSFIIGLYTNYAHAINDIDRVFLRNIGSGNNNTLEVSARASCVSDASPVRENKIALRFDRTTYTPKVVDWTPGSYYSSFYAGEYNTSETISSSSLSLSSEIPPVETFVSSKEGANFQISNVDSETEIVWSSRTRTVVSTAVSTNIITIAPSLGGAPDEGFVTPTTGFYVGMPIKFEGTSIGGIILNSTFYVLSIVSGTEITITLEQGSSTPFNLNNGTVVQPLYAITAKEINTTVITIDYPGIRPVTGTNGSNDSVTVPLSFSGLGGTSGLYPGVPVFFIGSSIGNIIENEIYYVSTVLSDTTLTLMTESTPLVINILSINGSSNVITCNTTSVISVNDPVIFTSMIIAGSVVTNFGNIEYGTRYYVNTKVSATQFTIKPFINYPIFDLTTVVAADNTGCLATNQKYLVDLSTDTGSMTINIGLPLSPGQLEGQKLTFYKTNTVGYSGVSGENNDLIQRKIAATVASGDVICLTTASGGISRMYVNMPLRLVTGIGGLVTGTTYYITELGNVTTQISATFSGSNVVFCASTEGLFIGMAVKFSGSNSFGNININTGYYIKTIIDGERFTLSELLLGPTLVLANGVGVMTLTGSPYIKVSTSLGGSTVAITDELGPVTLNQYPTSTPTFDVTYELGGYLTVIATEGTGFAVNNTIVISGVDLGGVDPTNDLTLLVDKIGTNGEITKVISYGTPFGPEISYYVDIVSPTTCKLYIDPLLKVPVPETDFPYSSYDFAFLPEPFIFNQSLVKYNGKVYECVISNSDEEFIVGKWELIDSGDRRLNALDRISGYYAPTINMPGNDITQLVSGTTYPYITYLGNSFSPEDEFILDTSLSGGDFTPQDINGVGIVWNGTNYIGAVNSSFSATITSPDNTILWVIDKVSEQMINLTDIDYDGTRYVMTANNNATPIFTSLDGLEWTAGYPSIPVDSSILNSVSNLAGVWVAVGDGIVTSPDGTTWSKTYEFTGNLNNQLNGVIGADLSNFNGFVAVGAGQETIGSSVVNRNIILISIDGETWTEPTSTLTSIGFNAVNSGDNKLVIVGDNSIIYSSTNGSNWNQATTFGTIVENLNGVVFGNGIFVAVGDNGVIKTSTDSDVWVDRTSGTTENLNAITFNSAISEFIVLGDNNTIIVSSNGISWTSANDFASLETVYNIQGQPFLSGYGPEELVPGVVSDNLTMIVTTRPGTTWDATIYQHVGYNVVSRVITQESGTETTFSFNDLVETPAQLSVYILDSTNDFLATRLYESNDYTVDWILKTISLTVAPSIGDQVFIEVYEVGNGNQLMKSNTDYEPIRTNEVTGFNEIALNCNFAATASQGSGVIRDGTFPLNVLATETSSIDNTITCENVDNFVVNSTVQFQGDVFGGVAIDTNYYIKTVSIATNKITISDTLSSGVSGPTFLLSSDTGAMDVIIQEGSGLVWTDPIVHYNGIRMNLGNITRVTRTSSITNSVTCNSTANISPNDPVVFSDTIFGGVLTPQTIYYVKNIVDANEFTVSTTLGGPVLVLTSAAGGAFVISNDYAFSLNDNGITANLILSGQYDNDVDYVTFTVFGQGNTETFGYTLPETEIFTADGSTSVFNITNNITEANSENAIVEVDGLRLSDTEYTLNSSTDELTLVSPPANGSTVAVTSFNETHRQYFLTEYDITGKRVTDIININNDITLPIAASLCTSSSSLTDVITCTGTENFVVDQPVIFKAPVSSFGGVNVTDTIYYVHTIVDAVSFKISTSPGGSVFELSDGSGSMFAYVGGQPAVRVTTGANHGFVTNDLVRIDGTLGSIQLNNNTYYARVIDSTTFDLYFDPYSQSYTADNNPVTDINAYISGGYTWLDESFVLVTTTATNTNSMTKFITVTDVSELVLGTPIVFTGSTFGGINAGTIYYISEIDANDIKVTETRGGDTYPLTTGSGVMNVTQWEQDNVDRLWVTLNGYRVAPSNLRINPSNNISILATIEPADEITIMSMIPSATPNELVYIQNVNKNNEFSVYKADNLLTTWLTEPLQNIDGTIYLDDVSRVVDRYITTQTVPIGYNPSTNPMAVQLNVDKQLITQILVYNLTTSTNVPTSNYSLQIENLSPIVVIDGSITVGDSVQITVILGDMIFINGEQIRFTDVDFDANTITGLQRGANGTAEQVLIPKYSRVYGALSRNRLPTIEYYLTWNSYIYNTTLGDPLQISDTESAIFLRTYRS